MPVIGKKNLFWKKERHRWKWVYQKDKDHVEI